MVKNVSSVLILGAGINGAALARELTLQGVSVVAVDTADIARGATAYSTRLIHGGLRYLEYGEFDLVRESLAERERLLRLAPQFVQPLRLYIPVANRLGGLIASARRFFRLERKGTPPTPRGLWVVRLGLAFYQWLAQHSQLPPPQVAPTGTAGLPPVDAQLYRWLCSYYDAQILYPERFVIALLADAQHAAAEKGAAFQLFTYARAQRSGDAVTIYSNVSDETLLADLRPAAIVNATGAWVDETLSSLDCAGPRLMAGTKGSHLVVSHPQLRAALAEGGLYAEAADGRPVFVLPLGDHTLVGTTDLPYTGDPANAVASEAEIDYLLATVGTLLPQFEVTREHILFHYSGVRPLPATNASKPSAVTRRHWLEEHHASKHAGMSVPLYSIIGGKLTTCRSLAESAANTLLARLGLTRRCDTHERQIANSVNIPPEANTDGISHVTGTQHTHDYVRHVIRHEWVTRLDDLVERRLMLLYEPRLSRKTLIELAELLVAEQRLPASNVESAVDAVITRLHDHFGRTL